MNASADPFLGKIIHGYTLVELLAAGTMTVVYRARTEESWKTSEVLATIIPAPDKLSEQAKQQFLARFLQEAEQIEALHHPGISPLYGYGEQDGWCYLLTLDVVGKTLSTYMKQQVHCTHHEALLILISISFALEYLHNQGKVWRFFNPAHVLIWENRAASTELIQLTGLGLISMLRLKGLEEVDISSFGHLKSIAGTYLSVPEYLAPEIVKGAEGDIRADVYSLGVLLFTLLSGTPPFTGESYLEIAQKHIYESPPSLCEMLPDSPIALELVVNRALHKNPARRFQNTEDLVTAYKQVIDERIQVPWQQNISEKLRRLSRRQMDAEPLPLTTIVAMAEQTQQLRERLQLQSKVHQPVDAMQEKKSEEIFPDWLI